MLDCIPANLFHITSAFGDIITTEVRPLGESVLIQTLFSALYTKLLETSTNEITKEKENTIDPGAVESTSLNKASVCSILGEAICSIDEDHKHTEGIQMLLNRSLKFHTNSSESESLTDELATMQLNSNNCNDARHSTDDNPIEYDVDSADFVAEVVLSDVLTTSVGKQSLKVI